MQGGVEVYSTWPLHLWEYTPCRVVWKFTSNNNWTCETILNAGWCGSFLQRVVVRVCVILCVCCISGCRSQCNGCMNVAWGLSWAGSRSTKPCVFPQCDGARAGAGRVLVAWVLPIVFDRPGQQKLRRKERHGGQWCNPKFCILDLWEGGGQLRSNLGVVQARLGQTLWTEITWDQEWV